MKIKLSKSQWQFIGKQAGWMKTAAAITEGFRICRKCGQSVDNEFIFRNNGLMCQKCHDEYYKEKLKK
jgi:uncharacterized paraquat-inducible protein A